jgi:putative copper export protein
MALATLLGTAWFHFWSMAWAGAGPIFTPLVLQRLRRLYLFCLAVLLISGLGILILRSMEMGGVGISEIETVLPTVLLKTHFGGMWMLRLAGLLGAWAIWWAAKRRMASASYFWAGGLLLAAVIIAFTRSSSGHLGDFGDFSTAQLGDWLHLSAVSCLAGSLVAIAVLFPPSPVRTEEEFEQLSLLADRFYFLFGPLLAILVFTGWHSSWLLVGSFLALSANSYGWLFCLKLLLFLVLACRYITPPRQGRDHRPYVTSFLRRTKHEAFLVTAIILCVSTLIHQVPARHLAHLAVSGEAGQHLDERLFSGSRRDRPVVSLTTKPPLITAGAPVKMSVKLTEPDGRPLQGLTIMHERILHAVIIGKDLEVFAHIHPEDFTPVSREIIKRAIFPLRFTFPREGEYLIGIDFAKNDVPYSKTFKIRADAAAVIQEPKIDLATSKTFGDYQVSFSVPDETITAGTETKLKYVIRKNGKDVSDLDPYLGATMHLAIVSADLKTFIHTHGVVPGMASNAGHLHLLVSPPARFGPEIEAEALFPFPGYYKIFGQFKHQGQLILADFMVDVH